MSKSLINDINITFLMCFGEIFVADFHLGPLHENAASLKDLQLRG